MHNQQTQTSSSPQRVFKTPIIVAVSVIAVILIYAGYALLYHTGTQPGYFAVFIDHAFKLFLMFELGTIVLLMYNKTLVSRFLEQHPSIKSKSALEDLKPVLRTNMYSSLCGFGFLAMTSLTAIMTILNYPVLVATLVVILSVVTIWTMQQYKPYEERLKQIRCDEEQLEQPLNQLLESWQHKALPDF